MTLKIKQDLTHNSSSKYLPLFLKISIFIMHIDKLRLVKNYLFMRVRMSMFMIVFMFMNFNSRNRNGFNSHSILIDHQTA